MKALRLIYIAPIIGIAAAIVSAAGFPQATDGPRFTSRMELIRPSDYREWVFLSSGVGMSYSANAAAQSDPTFDNVFVNPSSYRSFVQTGKWPDRTIFILEARHSAGEASINKAGRFQTDIAAIEANVKDSRLPGGWAWFSFGGGAELKESAARLPDQANCLQCHSKNGAVENTFVQFYPTLLEIARAKGTLKPGF